MLDLLRQLVAIPGPPGQESRVAAFLTERITGLGFNPIIDAKGNVLVRFGNGPKPRIVVTAHMDEIAMIVRRIEPDGQIVVGALGGLFPWKVGEGPVLVLAENGDFDAVLAFGSIHTNDPTSLVRSAESKAIAWEMVRVFTGYSPAELRERGVRPGTRVVVHPRRRDLFEIGPFVAAPFLDDRADLVSWLSAIETLKAAELDVLFVATAAEEVGGEGAKYVLQQIRPDVCIALELAARVGDAPIELNDQPVVWVTDSYSTMAASDGDLLAKLGRELSMKLQFQALSRGGSDASCAAKEGLCARPITLGLPMENSHGFEIMHPNAMAELARLTVALIHAIA